MLHTAHGREPDGRFIMSPGQATKTELRKRKESLKSLREYPARVRGLVVSNINVRESATKGTELDDERITSTRGNNPIMEVEGLRGSIRSQAPASPDTTR